jgi:hypothetical protein
MTGVPDVKTKLTSTVVPIGREPNLCPPTATEIIHYFDVISLYSKLLAIIFATHLKRNSFCPLGSWRRKKRLAFLTILAARFLVLMVGDARIPFLIGHNQMLYCENIVGAQDFIYLTMLT